LAGDLQVWLAEEGGDSDRLDAMESRLRNELLDLDVVRVAPLTREAPPTGAKAVDAVAAGALLVTLSQSADSLLSVISTIRQWLGREKAAHRSVRLEIAGQSLEISDATQDDQDRLIQLFVDRVATAAN
jgi:hypothetical protein